MHETFFTFFGLRENPFDGSLDPRYSFATPRFQKTLDALLFSIERGNTFAVLTGDIGTGKTFLIRRLLESLKTRGIPAGFIFYTHVDGNHLFDLVLADFGIPCDSRLKSDALQRLRDWLLSQPPGGKTPVLIVDEAQGLSDHALREIQMLLNLETPQQRLLQIVLAGEPTLEDKLARTEFRKLRQRITCRCTVEPFDAAETRSYIQRRLLVAGPQDDSIFASGAIELIDSYSRGIPRLINLLCEQSLIRAFSDKFRPIPAAMVQDAARDFQLEREALRPRYSVAAAGAGANAAGTVEAAPLEPFLASDLDPNDDLKNAEAQGPFLEPAALSASIPDLSTEALVAAALEQAEPASAPGNITEAPKDPSRLIVLPRPNRYDFLSPAHRRLFEEFLTELAESPNLFSASSVVESKPFVVSSRNDTVSASDPSAPPRQTPAAPVHSARRRAVRRRHPLGVAAWRDLARVLFSAPDSAKWHRRLDHFLEWLQQPVNPLQHRTRHVRGSLR